jgi:membrane-associated phospholipid phosphatase
MPPVFTTFVLGTIIGVFLAFFINIFSKISAHAVGMGGMIGMLFLLIALGPFDPVVIHLGGRGVIQTSMATVLLLCILIAGLVGTSRLLLKAHVSVDLYGGYLVGLGSQFAAYQILMV